MRFCFEVYTAQLRSYIGTYITPFGKKIGRIVFFCISATTLFVGWQYPFFRTVEVLCISTFKHVSSRSDCDCTVVDEKNTLDVSSYTHIPFTKQRTREREREREKHIFYDFASFSSLNNNSQTWYSAGHGLVLQSWHNILKRIGVVMGLHSSEH